MSRWTGPPPQPQEKGPNGRPLCRMCHEEVPTRRFTFCSDACVERMHLENGMVRPYVFKRDAGVCAECGLDTEEVRRFLDHLHELAFEKWREHLSAWEIPTGRVNLWDADHIVPWSEGGAQHGLENLRTLCLWCHKDRTRTWHGERAAARRPQLDLVTVDGRRA